MAFVNEIIPEQEKTGFNFPVQTLRDGSKPTLWKWTVDKEKKISLIHVNSEGGSYEGTTKTDQYVLVNEKAILCSLRGFSKVSGDMKVGQVLNWKLHLQVHAEAHPYSRQEIEHLVRESFDAMGLSYLRDCLKEVVIEFTDLRSIDFVDAQKQ